MRDKARRRQPRGRCGDALASKQARAGAGPLFAK